MIQALIRQGYLRQEGLRYPVLAITPEGREVMHNRTVARLGSWKPAATARFGTAPIADAGSFGHDCSRRAGRAPGGTPRLALPQVQRDGRSALHAVLGPNA